MACGKEELLKWVEGLDDGEEVWIDEGGLTLEASNGYYIEVGGCGPDEEEQ